MPNFASFAAVMRDWESLLAAYKAHAELLPDLEVHRALLEKQLLQAKALKDKQDLEEGLRRKTTQELKAVIDEGREQAIALRGLVKAHLGRKDKLLAQFGVAPFTPAKRRQAPDVKPVPEVGESHGPKSPKA
jgi:hypothetical protein